jgi:hypothetical protein
MKQRAVTIADASRAWLTSEKAERFCGIIALIRQLGLLGFSHKY